MATVLNSLLPPPTRRSSSSSSSSSTQPAGSTRPTMSFHYPDFPAPFATTNYSASSRAISCQLQTNLIKPSRPNSSGKGLCGIVGGIRKDKAKFEREGNIMVKGEYGARKFMGFDLFFAFPSFLPSFLLSEKQNGLRICLDLPKNERNEDFLKTKGFAVLRRDAMALIFSSYIFSRVGLHDVALAQPSVGFREYIDTFDGYSFKYPQNWIQVRGSGADIFFRDPFVLDENLSVELSSPSSSRYKSVEDLGQPQEAGKKVLQQYLTEFMSTRLGVRRESNIVSTSSRVADDGRTYYQVEVCLTRQSIRVIENEQEWRGKGIENIEVNIKSYANNNELAVMPTDRVTRLEWDRRYLSVLGVENNRLYELRLQTPESVFLEEENELRQVMDSFRVNKASG
ncbi:PsbP domain-containing protein 1, chloroplastic [Vitis vinifera]|uniref:PsbP domain-containing protein 1, chloroplastic n=1 Tax=Vitis vinifera TaxID=29760 RepID=A0A438DUD3_VITVI|nr:PsbP domain-containing protein 1, chloroplastic [Vitis vinifera]